MTRGSLFVLSGCVAAIAVASTVSYTIGFNAGQGTHVSVGSASLTPGATTTLDLSVEITQEEESSTPKPMVIQQDTQPAIDSLPVSFAANEQPKEEVEYVEYTQADNTSLNNIDGGPVTIASILKASLSIEEPEKRKRFLEEMTSQLDLDEVEGALVDMETLAAGPMKNEAAFALVNRMAQLNPLSAIEYASSEPQPKLRFEMKQEVMSGWASQNPSEALQYAELNPNGDLPYSRFMDVFTGAQELALADRLHFLEGTDPSKYRREMMDLVYESFSDYPRDIVEWSQSLPSGRLRDLALHRTIDHWARFDPLAAKQWMESVSEPHNLKNNYVELGESWARVDPSAAAEWYNQLPANEQSPRIMERIFKRWLQYEPDTAGRWLAANQSGANMDSVIGRYVDRLSYSNPEGAIDWASKMSNGELRQERLNSAAWRYIRKNPSQALQYFQRNTSLPADSRTQYIEAATRRLTPDAE